MINEGGKPDTCDEPFKGQNCDKFGDKREGWDNCSVCGRTDWDGLYKNKHTTEEIINLISQSEEIMDEISDIEYKFFEKNQTTYLSQNKIDKVIHPSIMGIEEIEHELALDEPFADYLGDRDLLVWNYLECLSKKNRTILFAESHDRIFGTEWIKTMRGMRREKGYEI